jgi:hypothetical protein
VRGQRSELPERHSAPECSAACRYAAVAAAYPHLRLWAASPETESAALRRAGSAMSKVLVLRPQAAGPAAQLESAARQQEE